MIKEEYVSFETAKLLKEKGFDVSCKVWYTEYTSLWGGDSSGDRKYINIQFDDENRFDESYKFLCYAPTLQMAMKWLREVHNLSIEPYYDFVLNWVVELKHIGKFTDIKEFEYIREKTYKSYEDACEAAIKYCLKNLI